MAFNREHCIFEVTKKSKSHLAVMGVPLKNGGHVLFPEEAVYLIEHHNAYATDGGRLLTLHGGYRILHECGISMYKFRAYSSLRQAGFVVLRPNRSFVHSLQLYLESSLDSANHAFPRSRLFPQNLLDKFPTWKRAHMYMPQLHRNERIVPISNLGDFVLRPCSYKFSYKMSYSTRSGCRYDFEVFLTDRFVHSVPSEPAFVVLCFESRDGAMSCSYVHRCSGENPLMLSIYDSGHVCFIEISGKPIDLNQYLKYLTTISAK
ncbi:hypothetical protein DICVIV_13130 [Dictyocaulus viviparus]|uniref:tRNA-splicing endonuclease subunit Sen54 N-terminal domain-containing protein n=1 Tax=Dictyocaulus viviparus TaxID=29172 RepID=A0A0D8X8K7_DICVI|nr:hypothetical protein DICVIV_13130 [Dictyocaulus viviparus]